MKAYRGYMVHDDPDLGACIVFGENVKEAKESFLFSDVFQESEQNFVNIRLVRAPEFDASYRGETMLDPEDPRDRKAFLDNGWIFANSYEEEFDEEKS